MGFHRGPGSEKVSLHQGLTPWSTTPVNQGLAQADTAASRRQLTNKVQANAESVRDRSCGARCAIDAVEVSWTSAEILDGTQRRLTNLFDVSVTSAPRGAESTPILRKRA